MPKPGVSDHALVNWLKRSGAMDVERMRDMLANSLERACTAGAALGSSRFLVLADGLVYVVQDDVVVTVVDDDGRHAAVLGRRDRTAP